MTKIRIYNFRKFANKVLSHKKKITMRKVRKRQSERGELMHPYIVYYPGEATIGNIKTKRLRDITLKEALADGFKSIEECQQTLMKMHSTKHNPCTLSEKFNLTPFEPHWQPMLIVNLTELRYIRESLQKIHWDLTIDKKHGSLNPETEDRLSKTLSLVERIINTDDPKVDTRKNLGDYLDE